MIFFIQDKNPIRNYRPTILGILVFELVQLICLITVVLAWYIFFLLFKISPTILINQTMFNGFNIHYVMPKDFFSFISIIICALVSSILAIKGIKIMILKLFSESTIEENNFWNTYRLKFSAFLVSIIINSIIFAVLERI